MISIELLQIFGIVTGIFCMFATYKCWRLTYIPLHWVFFAALMLISFGVSVFYFEVGHELLTMDQLRFASRWLYFADLVVITIMAISVLIYRE